MQASEDATLHALDQLYRADGRWGDLAALHERTLETARGDHARRARFELAALYRRAGEQARAVETLGPLLRADAEDTPALELLADLHGEAGNWAECVKVLEDRLCASSDPAERQALSLRIAEIHLTHTGRVLTAHGWVRAVLDLDAENAEGRSLLALTERRLAETPTPSQPPAPRPVELPPAAHVAAMVTDTPPPGLESDRVQPAVLWAHTPLALQVAAALTLAVGAAAVATQTERAADSERALQDARRDVRTFEREALRQEQRADAMLALTNEARRIANEQEDSLRTEVARLEQSLQKSEAQREDVREEMAERLDRSIDAIEGALEEAGVPAEALARGGGASQGLGGPFVPARVSLVSPIAGIAKVMSPFGFRGKRHHDGIDIPATVDTPVRAVADGVVLHVQDRAAWSRRPKWEAHGDSRRKSAGSRAGAYVEVEHADGRVSRYLHLDRVAPSVREGRKIRAREMIGRVGLTGVEKSDPHLHFELREPSGTAGRFGRALDPDMAATVPVHTRIAASDPLDAQLTKIEHLQKRTASLPLVAPVASVKVASGFGLRRDPLGGGRARHTGIDVSGALRDPVWATAPGKVVYAGWRGRYGTMVEIDHGGGVTTRYGHLHKAFVHIGQRVESLQRVGLLGSSGRSSGNHLHYEVLVDGRPNDPMLFLRAGDRLRKREAP